MNLGQFLLLVVILGAILGFIGVPWWMSRQARDPRAGIRRVAYLAAIDALIKRDRPAALLALRELAQKDPANIRAYLRLGDLVRKMGYPERAYRIHADLLARNIEDEEDAAAAPRESSRGPAATSIARKTSCAPPRSCSASIGRTRRRCAPWSATTSVAGTGSALSSSSTSGTDRRPGRRCRRLPRCGSTWRGSTSREDGCAKRGSSSTRPSRCRATDRSPG